MNIKLTLSEQKGLAHIFLLILLLAGIAGGVYLVSKPGFQIFKPKASSESFEFINGSCVKDKDGEKVLTCEGPVEFKLTSPLESGSTTDASFQIIKTAYAAGSGKDYFCDPSLQNKEDIFHRDCNAVFDILCDWKLFGAKWEDIAEHCDIGLECQSISQGVFDSGARCVAEEPERSSFPAAPIQPAPARQPSSTNLTPQVATPRPTPVPTLGSIVQPTATPRPITPTLTPTLRPTPTPASTPVGTSSLAAAAPASKNATLSLFPSSWTAYKGCGFSVQIRLNTATAQTIGTDVTLLYDPTRLTAISSVAGTIYADYPGNYIDPSGKVLISGLARVPSSFLGLGILATVNFNVKEDAPDGPTQVRFDFDPNDKSKTTDSNVIEKGINIDLLTAVSNGEYTIGTGICPAGTVGTGETASSGIGQTNPQAGTTRITTHYRFAETPDKFQDKDFGWETYNAGGVTVTHTFKESGTAKFIYAQFRDNEGNIINANPYPVQINLISEAADKAAAPPKVTPATTCKIAEPDRTCTPPTAEKCEIKTLADIGNCTNEQLLVTLTKDQLGTIPLERMKTFGSNALMCFFPRDQVARLNANILNDLPNEDLLLLGDASGDCKTFLSNFSCTRIVLLPSEYQALTSCGR